MGDHGGSTAETYYNQEGEPVFLFHFRSHWTFTGKEEGDTEDRVTERRVYFNGGQIIRALEKKYVFADESEMQKAANTAKHTTLDYSPQAAARLLPTLKELRDAKAAKGLSVNNSYNLLVILAITRVSFQLN
ncbi:MAG: hypothetical protein ACI8XO_000286 [Verrucomicrobiales bacterium]|jgi:hypothetical protein